HTVADEESVRVLITDSGSGIAESVRPRIFEPFFTTKAASHGTGLGLAISREIVLEHQGTLTVEPADRGARFCVSFARARA
ncbi:MAG: ATP-binding protein, partial [Caldimonas sp.]